MSKPTPQTKGSKVLFTRYSRNGVNGVRQEKVGHASHHAPERHGLWVFLGGFEELYLAGGQFQQLKNHGYYPPGCDYELEDWVWDEGWDEASHKRYVADFRKKLFRKIWWDGPVYANINSKGNVVRDPDFGGTWCLHPSAKDYLAAAKKALRKEIADKMHNGYGWGNDHFECFLPGKKF